MHTTRTLFQVITIAALMGALFVNVPQVHAAGTTFTVNTVLDATGDHQCSFQEAVLAANGDAGGEDCGIGSNVERDKIRFVIGTGAKTINLSVQQTFKQPVFIDGSTQPGYAGIPLIRITGSASYLFWFNSAAGGSTVKAIKFTNMATGPGYGVDIRLNDSSDNVLVGNYFNTNGTSSLGSMGKGISLGTTTVGGGSSRNRIGGSTSAARNYFGGLNGVEITAGSDNVIQGNYFGVKRDGNLKLEALSDSIEQAVSIGSSGKIASGNLVRDNVIAGYNSAILLVNSSDQTTIAGNKIGIGANGKIALGNAFGIRLWNSNINLIGGTSAADRNVIAASTFYNIMLDGVSNNNFIRGNYIGTDATGLYAVTPRSSAGIFLSSGDANTIGGTAPGSGNLISGNDQGIGALIGATGTLILGNKIGTDRAGLHAIPNNTGISLDSTAANIGDATTPGNNLISGNDPGYYGIYMSGTAAGTTIYGNKIGLSSAGETALRNGTGIALENGYSATIAGNWIGRHAVYGLYIGTTGSVLASSQNCFTDNVTFGVYSLNPASMPLTGNWWGSASGPTEAGNIGGTGDAIYGVVDYSGFLPSPAAACTNLLLNPSFDTDADHNHRPDNWTYTSLSTTTDKQDCVVRKAGTCSLKLVGNAVQKIARQTMLYSGQLGDDIVFSAWSKASGVPAGSIYRLQMNVYSGATLLGTRSANFTAGTHTFQQAAITYTAPAAYDKVVVTMIFKAASGTAWFDVAFHGWAP